MAVSSKPSRRIDASPPVLRWRAEQARRAARARTDRGRGRRYSWPADQQVIVSEILAAAVPGQAGRRAESPDER